jgi:hypothetical protein
MTAVISFMVQAPGLTPYPQTLDLAEKAQKG